MNNSEKNTKELELSLIDIFFTLLKKWWIILISAIVVGALSFTYFSFIATPTYTSQARILIGRQEDPRDTTTSFTINTLNIATSLTKEFSYLIKEPIVLDPVVETLELNTSARALSGSVSVTLPASDLRILDISVNASTPEMAYKINNEILNQCAIVLPTIHEHAKIEIVVTTPANVPSTPVSPDVAAYTVLGILLGAALSAVAVLIIDIVIKTKANAAYNEAVAITAPVEPEPVKVAEPEPVKATKTAPKRTTKKKAEDKETDK